MLRILCVIESGTWLESHIASSLKAGGHLVEVFNYGPVVGEFYGYSRRRDREAKNKALLEVAARLRSNPGLDLVFCYVYDDFLEIDTARALAGLGVPMVNWNVDMVGQWYRQTRTARFFTRMLCAQRANMDNLARYNSNVRYFPMAARSDEGGASNFSPAAPVTFLGTPTPYRVRVLARVHKAGIPLAVYGKYWQEGRQAVPASGAEKSIVDLWHYGVPKWRAEGGAGLVRALQRRLRPESSEQRNELPDALLNGVVPEDSLRFLFRRSRVNIGFTRMIGEDPDAPGVNQVKLRDFEVPQAGGFYLVEHAPEYAELFRIGKEVETWRTPAELIEKIRYFLEHEAQRQAIARAGEARANAEHTWNRRFASLFADLGLPAR